MNKREIFWISLTLSMLAIVFGAVLSCREAAGQVVPEEGAEGKEVKAAQAKEEAKDEVRDEAQDQAQAQENNNKALALIKEERIEEAVDLLEKAVDLDPANKDIRRNLAVAYSWAGRQGEAIDTLKRLVKESPDYAEGHRHLVLIYNMEGLYKEAIVHGEKALALNPEDYSVAGYMAYNYYTVGEHKKAIATAQKLSLRDPENVRPYRILAMSYVALGRIEEAREAFEKSHGISPESKERKETKEEIQAREKMFQEMTAQVYFMEGNRFIENGDQAKSIEAYNRSIKINPNDYRAYYNLAAIYDRMKDASLALGNLAKAAELNPGIIKQIVNTDDFGFIKDKSGFQDLLKKYGGQ
ncbi:MAG: tetratricopeptide repeat protein [Candidatus Omnitrophota bacterium]